MKDDEKEKACAAALDPSEIVNGCSIELVHPKMAIVGFGYAIRPLEVEIAEQARHRGFIRVHKLVDAMAECAGWEAALPHAYRLLCCDRLPDALTTTEGKESRGLWYEIMRVLMSDTQVDWLDVDSSLVPPEWLQPYEYVDGKFVPSERRTGFEFAQQFVKLDEFKVHIERMADALRIPLILPEKLFAVGPRIAESSKGKTTTQEMWDNLVPKAMAIIADDPEITWEDLAASLAIPENFDKQGPRAIAHIQKELMKRGVRCKKGRRANK